MKRIATASPSGVGKRKRSCGPAPVSNSGGAASGRDRRRPGPLSGAAAILLTAVSVAQAAPSPRTLPEQRVTANALPTTPASASQHVTVLKRADLDALRGQSLTDVLARQAGVVIDRGARGGGFGALYLRGADPSHVVVLIDHVRQNDPLSSRGSAVDLGSLSIDDVERIEIVRGNASVANAEAIAGLIHIFTRRDAPGGEAGVGFGGSDLRAAHARLAATTTQLSAAWREDGDGSGGFARTRTANLAWQPRLHEKLALNMAARLGDSAQRGFPDDSGGPRFAERRLLDHRSGDTRQLSLRAEFETARGALATQIARFARDGDESTPGVAPGTRDPFGLPPLLARGDYERDEAQLVWHLPLGATLLTSVGVQHQRERGRLDSEIDFGVFRLPATFALKRNTSSAFAEARWQVGAWTVQGGIRHERRRGADASDADGDGHRDTGNHPMLSLHYAPGAGRGHWGASLARASKAPSFFALGHPLVGNPGLKSETARQRELFYATAADSAWPTRITLFSARYRDLVDFEAGPPPRLVNRARIEADGIEWRSGHRFGNDWWLQLDGTWMRVRDPEGEVKLRHRPRVQAGAQLSLPLAGERTLDLRLRHLGSRLDSSIPTGDRRLDAVTTLDLGLRQRLGPIQLLLAIDNLGNSRDDETLGSPLPGRRLRLALDWRPR